MGKDKWIPIENKLPDKEGLYYTKFKQGFCCDNYFIINKDGKSSWYFKGVVAWNFIGSNV